MINRVSPLRPPIDSSNQQEAVASSSSPSVKQASGGDALFVDELIEQNTTPATVKPEVTNEAPEDLYAQTRDAQPFFKRILKFIIKIIWSVGGNPDSVDNIPRVTGKTVQPLMEQMKPGDVILNGNSGGLSHAAMYVGDGQIIHAMATEKTMRGVGGAIWDAIKRPFKSLIGQPETKTGVIKESLADFLDRFERDTVVVVRKDGLDEAQVQQGVQRLNDLVGKPYDYDFSANDEEYYCSELAVEFLEAAMGKDDAPVFATTHHKYPGILATDAIEPHLILENGAMTAVVANDAAVAQFGKDLGDANIVSTS